jgi:hypothetical protein
MGVDNSVNMISRSFSPQNEKSKGPPDTQEYDNITSLVYLEDLSEELEKKFVKFHLRPYFLSVFADLSLRSSTFPNPSGKIIKSIDKVTFVEYINLPGIVSDRFYKLASATSTDTCITVEPFVNIMLSVFCASLDKKMELVF